jgi:superfamily II DNA or RNA helicase
LSEGKYSKELLSQFGFVIVDECHHIAALTLSQVMPQIPSKYVLGISATPERNDGLEHLIYWLLGPCAFVYKRLPSITGISHTVTIKQIIFSGGLDKTDARMWNGQLAFAEMINRLAEDHERNKVLVDIILKCYLEGRKKILVISSIVDHAKKLKNQLLSHVSNAVSQHDVFSIFGGTRQEIVQKSKTDSARVVFASYAYVGEGYDDATIDTMVLALPRSSIQQIIGRCERVHVGKLTPVVYDLIDDFSIFESMSYKRQKFYKSRGFLCTRSRWIPSINTENDESKKEND